MKSMYQTVYEKLCPDDQLGPDDPRRPLIIDEMKALYKAPSVETATAVIRWWDVWPNQNHLTVEEFVAEARSLIDSMRGKRNVPHG
jgi:hypothetical protein